MLLSVILCLQQACMSQESDTCNCKFVVVVAVVVIREFSSLMRWISNLSA